MQSLETGNGAGKNHLGRVAMGYFLDASYRVPGSVVAQGAYVAREARVNNHSVRSLKDALIHDRVRMEKIRLIAEDLHRGSATAPSSIGSAKTWEVVNGVFDQAVDLRYLSVPNLEHLYGPLYDFYRSQAPVVEPGTREHYMRQAFERMNQGRIVEVVGIPLKPSEPFVLFQR